MNWLIDMTPQTIGIIASLGTIIGLIIGYAVRLERRFARLESGMEHLRKGINQVIRQSNTMLGLSGTLIGLLAQKEVITKEQFGVILQDFTGIGHISEVSPNPLSRKEVQRLNEYIRKARRGGHFTRAEVEDYNELVERLEEERPDDPNIWPLVALAAFLLGLYLGTRR